MSQGEFIKTNPFSLCLWFNSEAEDAAKFYTSIFNDGKIGKIRYFGKEGFEFHQKPEGSVMTIEFEANGLQFMALNGGPEFKFTEAISLVINCNTQKEIDYYWEKLLAHGGRESQCGWLTDRFGLSWQVVPRIFDDMLDSSNKQASSRVMEAMFTMKKFDISKLQQAYQG